MAAFDQTLDTTIAMNESATQRLFTRTSPGAHDTSHATTTAANTTRVRDLYVLDAMYGGHDDNNTSRAASNTSISESLGVTLDPQKTSGVASQHLAEILSATRRQGKLAKKYHSQAVQMLKQPYMHIEGSRYCLSLGVHSHAGPSAKQSVQKMTLDYRIAAEGFQTLEEAVLRFAIELEKGLVEERRQTSEIAHALQQERQRFARLAEHNEAQKQSLNDDKEKETRKLLDFKENNHQDRMRERDAWEKERDRHRNRDGERERELDRMVQRHTAEAASLEREKDRQKRELLRESAEVDRLTKEVDRLVRANTEQRDQHQRLVMATETRHDQDMSKKRLDGLAAEKNLNDKVAQLQKEIVAQASHHEGLELMWGEQQRQLTTEKAALHSTIIDMRREWEDAKSKLNTLAADNILLREVMTDLRVSNNRLGNELKTTLNMPLQSRPKWNPYTA